MKYIRTKFAGNVILVEFASKLVKQMVKLCSKLLGSTKLLIIDFIVFVQRKY